MRVEIAKRFKRLPPFLRWAQVKWIMRELGCGGRVYCEDLRDLGVLRSVNGFVDGPRARYSRDAVLKVAVGQRI